MKSILTKISALLSNQILNSPEMTVILKNGLIVHSVPVWGMLRGEALDPANPDRFRERFQKIMLRVRPHINEDETPDHPFWTML